MDSKLVVFQDKQIRRTLHNGEWWFSVVDVCHALTGSVDAGAYWRKLKQRLNEEGSEVVTHCHGLKLVAPEGKKLEVETGEKVLTAENYLAEPEVKKRIKGKKPSVKHDKPHEI